MSSFGLFLRRGLFGVLGILVGCGGGADDDTIDADALPEVALEEVFRAGSVDDPDAGFSRVGGVAVGDDGRVYAIDAIDRHVVVLAPSGQRERVIGGPGEGPGEFGLPSRIGFIGDTLWVQDVEPARITFFSADGELLDTRPTPPVTIPVDGAGVSAVLVRPGVPRPDGRWEGIPAFGIGSDSVAFSYPVVLFDETGSTEETGEMREIRMPPVSVRVEDLGEDFTIPAPMALADWPIRRAVDSDTVADTVAIDGRGSERTASSG